LPLGSLIDFNHPVIRKVLPLLLRDKTTGRNILWATDTYAPLGPGYAAEKEIQPDQVSGFQAGVIAPRTLKSTDDQQSRTRKHAEVFTPAWVCNRMNNFCDEDWFGRAQVFNREEGQLWSVAEGPVVFPGHKKWQRYVDSRRLEITCGEAPFLVSRYDASTSEPIPFHKRVGVLDRKLRVVGENTQTEEEWLKWTVRAFQSVYGYEFQGDNLLIARVNLLFTFCEALALRWQRDATEKELLLLANILAWNLWQMDGLKGTIPFGTIAEANRQLSFFDLPENGQPLPEQPACRLMDWRGGGSLRYLDRMTRKGKELKFDYVIGNPPYQDETVGTQKAYAPPIYHLFVDEAIKIGEHALLIHPARFLFDAGGTPKQWNQKMLNDPHFKVLIHEQNSAKIFPNTDIKGGIAITYRAEEADYGSIGTYTAYIELNTILKKVKKSSNFLSFSDIIANRGLYRFSKKAYSDHPNEMKKITDARIGASSFERMPELFTIDNPDNSKEYVRFLGLIRSKRECRWFKREYFNPVASFDKYKVFVPAANGSGALGEVLSTPVIGQPVIGHTETFMSIGCFDTEQEATACYKYVCSKFCRVMLGILKITQHNSPDKWKYVPLQDFTSSSDIDWSKSIPEIDRQLYQKYGLSEEEVDFIESHVKEMT